MIYLAESEVIGQVFYSPYINHTDSKKINPKYL